jgi:hypothetical protein
MVIKPSIKTCIWHKAVEILIDQLYFRKSIFPVLTSDNQSCDKEAFIKNLGITPAYELPWIPEADTYINSGTPIYQMANDNKKCLAYKKTIDDIANALINK